MGTHLDKEGLATGQGLPVRFLQDHLDKREAGELHIHRSELHSTRTISLLTPDLR